MPEKQVQILSHFLYMLSIDVAQSSGGSTICTSDFVVTLFFHGMEQLGQNQRQRIYFVEFTRWQHQLDVRQQYVWSSWPDGARAKLLFTVAGLCTIVHVDYVHCCNFLSFSLLILLVD